MTIRDFNFEIDPQLIQYIDDTVHEYMDQIMQHLGANQAHMPAPLLWNGRELIVMAGTTVLIAKTMYESIKAISGVFEGQETINTTDYNCPIDINGFRFGCKISDCTEVKCSPWNYFWNGCQPSKECQLRN